MKKTSFYAGKIKVINGVKQFILTSKERYHDDIQRFKDGEEVYLYISTQQPTRSQKQNALYWGAYLPLISEKTGYTTNQLHALFKKKYLSYLFEEADIMGERVMIEPTTTQLTVKEFTQYLRDIEADTEILIPEL